MHTRHDITPPTKHLVRVTVTFEYCSCGSIFLSDTCCWTFDTRAGSVLRILPNHHEHIGDGAFVQQELTRHSSYLSRSVEREVVHTCHPIKSDGQRLAGDTCGKSGAALFGSKETLTCRFRPNVGSSEHLQERRETPARPLVEAC
jgi:hypothetical protein